MEQRLYRSRENKLIAGVCGGIGEFLRLDPVIVRIVFVLLALAKGIAIVAYLVAWVLIPKRELGQQAPAAGEYTSWNRYLPGLILIAVGAVLLIQEHFWWFDFSDMWPALLILGGLALVYTGVRSHQRRLVEKACADHNATATDNNGGVS